MTETCFRPSPGQSPQSWSLRNGILSGPDTELDLYMVHAVTLRDAPSRGRRARQVTLHSGADDLTLSLRQPSDQDPDNMAEYDRLIAALATDLAQRRPALTVSLGESGLSRSLKHGLGWAALVAGLLIGWRASVLGLSGNLMGLVALPMLLLIASGLLLILAHRPRPRAHLDLPVTQMRILLETLDRD